MWYVYIHAGKTLTHKKENKYIFEKAVFFFVKLSTVTVRNKQDGKAGKVLAMEP